MFKDKTTTYVRRYYKVTIHELDHWFSIVLGVTGSQDELERDEGPMANIRPHSLERYTHVMVTQWSNKYPLMDDLVAICEREANASLQSA